MLDIQNRVYEDGCYSNIENYYFYLLYWNVCGEVYDDMNYNCQDVQDEMGISYEDDFFVEYYLVVDYFRGGQGLKVVDFFVMYLVYM